MLVHLSNTTFALICTATPNALLQQAAAGISKGSTPSPTRHTHIITLHNCIYPAPLSYCTTFFSHLNKE
jgi:hypothetical protein